MAARALEYDKLTLNLVRKVKFFREFNTGLRVVSAEEEERPLRNAAP